MNTSKTVSTDMYHNAGYQILRDARNLRKTMTRMERILWKHICKKQISGARFRRQHPIWHYIADFYCHTLQLVIEVDGPIHLDPGRSAYDKNRDAELLKMGVLTLRFTNDQIQYHLPEVLEKIKVVVERRKKQTRDSQN